MPGEGRHLDYKVAFEPKDVRAKTALVKDIVAMANSGGGELIFGRDETTSPGLQLKLMKDLDSARLLDYVEKYVDKGLIHLHHDIQSLENGNLICTIAADAADYPVVMRKDGNWSDMGNSKPLFHRGDVWVRHGSKTERFSQADMRKIVDDAFRKGLDRVLSAAQIVRKGGPASSLEFRTESGEVIRSPSDLLNFALSRRSLELPYLLSGKELLWLFSLRDSFNPTTDQLELIIESALRRPVTLYWWLLDSRVTSEMIRRLLFRVPSAKDRDKSDAAQSAIELGAFFLSKSDMKDLLQLLVDSRYAHFRTAASSYVSKSAVKQAFIDRIRRARIDGSRLQDLPEETLEDMADRLATEALSDPSLSISRRLADMTRSLWGKEQGWIS